MVRAGTALIRGSAKKKAVLGVVVPCYNEEPVINETIGRLKIKLKAMKKKGLVSEDSFILFVDDGSADKTWKMVEDAFSKDAIIRGLKLAHNVGHQRALLAGLMTAKEEADIVISMDADLQDDINVMDKFVKKYLEGYEIVYGVRSSREKDSFFKRNTALIFYRLMKWMGVETINNHADYRLMSKKALDELARYKEVNLFLRGVVPLIGLKTTTVEYERHERYAGESKYPIKKMLAFGMDGITSFSVKPIRLILSLGVIFVFVSIIMTAYAVGAKIMGNAVDGWTFIVCSIWLIAGVQMVSIGIIGEYVSKTYMETKERPRYAVEAVTEKVKKKSRRVIK